MEFETFAQEFASDCGVSPAELQVSQSEEGFFAVAPCGTFCHWQEGQWEVSWNSATGSGASLAEANSNMNHDSRERYEVFLQMQA